MSLRGKSIRKSGTSMSRQGTCGTSTSWQGACGTSTSWQGACGTSMSRQGTSGTSTSLQGKCGTSTSRQGICGTRTSRRGRRASTIRCNMEHDIYGAYCEDDQLDVLPILDVLRENRLDIYDPHLEGRPNETLLKSWLERGIHRSNITLIFLTKRFITHNYCKFQADSAVMRYTGTRGQHRIVLVMLQSCKVPKNLLHFNCVYAWRFREEPLAQHNKILQAIFAPKDKFRRGNIMWTSMNTNSAKLAGVKCSELPCFKKSSNRGQPLLKYKHLLFNLNRIKCSLENCELKCTSENCTFRCSGLQITDQFFEHVKLCKYQQVQCRYCRQLVFRKNLQKHEETTCRHRCVPCPNESCGNKLTAREMFKHVLICSYKEEVCPNNGYGCTGIFARKDKSKHLEICDYEKLCCGKCNVLLFRVVMDDHICKVPQLNGQTRATFSHIGSAAVYKCCIAGCSFTGYKGDVETHHLRCDLRIEQCSDCGTRLPVRDHAWHKTHCDKIVQCELCHQYVSSSSKLTHDRWICTGQNIRSLCEICRTCVSDSRKENHSALCVLQGHNSPTIVRNMPLPDTVPGLGERHAKRGGASSDRGPMRSAPITIPEDHPESCHARNSLNYQSFGGHIVIVDPKSLSSPQSYGGRWTPSRRDKWRNLMAI